MFLEKKSVRSIVVLSILYFEQIQNVSWKDSPIMPLVPSPLHLLHLSHHSLVIFCTFVKCATPWGILPCESIHGNYALLNGVIFFFLRCFFPSCFPVFSKSWKCPTVPLVMLSHDRRTHPFHICSSCLKSFTSSQSLKLVQCQPLSTLSRLRNHASLF